MAATEKMFPSSQIGGNSDDDDEGINFEDSDDESNERTIKESQVLESTGEDEMVNVTQLLLRNCHYECFETECGQALPNLINLSLSHNRVTSLASFSGFGALRELNLNFNNIASLEGLVAPFLTKLFLSSNRLADLSGFSSRFPNIECLCLFRNALNDLEGTLDELAHLKKLKELDLDGNPFCRNDGSYRHRVVSRLDRLRKLDGDELTNLDSVLAESYITASSKLYTMQPDTSLTSSTSTSNYLGKVKMTDTKSNNDDDSDDALGGNPLLVTYQASQLLEDTFTPRCDDRGSTHHVPSGSTCLSLDLSSLKQGTSMPLTARTSSTLNKVLAFPPSSGPLLTSRSSGPLDMSDPFSIIRRLVRLVEMLQEEKESTDSVSDVDLKKEVEELRIENANMFLIQEENRVLTSANEKASLLELEVATLRASNEKLERELKDLSAQLQALHLRDMIGASSGSRGVTPRGSGSQQVQQGSIRPSSSSGGRSILTPLEPVNLNMLPLGGGTEAELPVGLRDIPRPRTAAAVMEECDDEIDSEVAELLAMNEASLKQLRKDVKTVKKELDRDQSLNPSSEPAPSRQSSTRSKQKKTSASSTGSTPTTRPQSSSSSSRPSTTPGSKTPPPTIGELLAKRSGRPESRGGDLSHEPVIEPVSSVENYRPPSAASSSSRLQNSRLGTRDNNTKTKSRNNVDGPAVPTTLQISKTKLPPKTSGSYGDVITVHSPRQAARIFDMLN